MAAADAAMTTRLATGAGIILSISLILHLILHLALLCSNAASRVRPIRPDETGLLRGADYDQFG
jgi:hypothetical protein